MVRRALLVLVLLLAGCGQDSPETTKEAPVTFTNPVFAENFPDPGALLVDGTWFAYGTNGPAGNVPVMTSPDLVHWTPAGDAMPSIGRWALPGNTWAPEVIAGGDGRYLLYYTARSAETDRQCLGVAVSDQPGGPFRDGAGKPLVCQAEEGGSIDASPYRDPDGGLWLYWKNDGNAIGQPTYLYGSKLSADGLSLSGESKRLLVNDAAWEAHVIEAPQMVRRDGRLYLFYSANAFDAEAYALGYAVCEGPLGPCRKADENPILSTSPAAAGPGHGFLVEAAGGRTWLLYHAWPPDSIGSVTPGRQLWLDEVVWEDGKPVVRGPTAEPQPMP
ncbi:glycoside hydrolase family 43 protein [Actinoplanes sp. GCM10030250]|uniref:glycoside hydrolase family 43 protein n=1 Tax=Actinoplanes sp. GCM10030250 TaxID=3273376 RepID=UPI00360D7C12